MQTFISVHNQDYILKLEKNNIFRNLSDYKYLFLGFNPIDKLEHLKDKIIIARELPDNIEHDKCLFDYTGWYAISRNKLAKSEHLSIVHYDCLIYKSFECEIEKAFRKNKDYFINFQPHSLACDYFISDNYAKTAIDAIKDVFNIDIKQKIHEAIKNGDKYWPGGGSFACSVEWLDSYVDWIEKIHSILITDPMASHNIERTMKFYNILYNVKEKYLPQIMMHIYNADHEQEYTSKECQIRHRTKFARFMNGELSEEIEAQKKEKNYLKLLKITLKQLIYKFF